MRKKVQNNYRKYFLSKNWSCKVITMGDFYPFVGYDNYLN